jgi:hypothetical protein
MSLKKHHTAITKMAQKALQYDAEARYIKDTARKLAFTLTILAKPKEKVIKIISKKKNLRKALAKITNFRSNSCI